MKQTQQAAEIRQKINDIITGRTRIEHIFHYDGSYKTIEGDQLTEITPEQAAAFMLAGSRLYYIAQDLRKWDNDLNRFTGQEAQHPPLPDVPEGADVKTVSTTFDPAAFVQTFIRHPQWTSSN
jgi:hypothetical protein